jgi:hypothetical protein
LIIYTFDVNASDIDVGDVLSYNISSTPPSDISINSATGVITWTPETVGNYTINISVADAEVTIYHEFLLTVTQGEPNTAPTATLISPADQALVKVVNPFLLWSVTDEDGDITASDIYLGKVQADVDQLDPSTRIATSFDDNMFSITDNLDLGQTYYWTVIPKDGKAIGSCTNGVWSFDVTEDATENLPPSVTSTPGTTATVGQEYTYTPTAEDGDGDTVTFELESTIVGMTFTGGTLSWVPIASQVGSHEVMFDVSDGKTSILHTFTIVVSEAVGASPVISPIPTQPIKVGETLQ